MQKAVRSPLIWFGGKGQLAKKIHQHFPNHKCFVDLMCGSLDVTVQKEPVGIEVVNDIDGDLVNFLLVLRDDPEKLAAAVERLPYSRELYEQWKWEEKPKDKFERAKRWFYLNRSAVAAGNNHRSGWRHGNTVNPAKDYHSAIDRLEKFAARLKHTMIENRDWREIIKTYDSPDTLFYVDPPYIGNERRYKGKWKKQDHIDLADALEGIQGKAIVSYYPCETIDLLYNGWHRVEIATHTTSQVSKCQERPERTELLLMNWNDPQLTIFDVDTA